MKNSVLVVVHPDYVPKSGFTDPMKYGDYDSYTSRLKDAIWSADRCFLFMYYPESKIQTPENMEVVYDRGKCECDVRTLIPRLKRIGTKKVDLCGEFLWFYDSNDLMDVGRIMRSLPPQKLEEFRAFLNKHNIPSKHILIDVDDLETEGFQIRELFKQPKVFGACVQNVQKKLSKHFPVELRRELCYPTKDPIKFKVVSE